MGTALHVARLSLLFGTFGLVTLFTTASAHSATGGEDVEWPFTRICAAADDEVEWP